MDIVHKVHIHILCLGLFQLISLYIKSVVLHYLLNGETTLRQSFARKEKYVQTSWVVHRSNVLSTPLVSEVIKIAKDVYVAM